VPEPCTTRFIHTADWQIGKPYRTVSDPQKQFRLQQERLNAIGRIGDAVRQAEAGFVLVAGDLFDSTTPTSNTVLEVLEAIGAMEVPVLVIPGNHDHGGQGSVWHRDDFQRQQPLMAPNLQLLLERRPLELEQAVVLPAPLLRNQDSSDPCLWLQDLDWGTIPAHKPRLVLAHGGVHGFGGRDYDIDRDHGIDRNHGIDEEAPAGANNLIDLQALPDAEIDYIALGDWHNLKQVNARSWYAGTPEPDRFDQGEANQRGQVLQVDVGRGQPAEVRILPTGRLHWHNLRFRFSSDADLGRLERQLQELTAGRVARDLLRLEVSGSLSLAGHHRYEQLLADLGSRLLRLRIKGECQQAPEAAELEQLTGRAEDPLIAGVAANLQRQIAACDNPDSDQAAELRLALCELFRLANTP
jgi:DNA repair exonuclease SbcCD nuclease subunit